MNPEPQSAPELPLEELKIVPQWARSSPRTYEHHTGEDREQRRSLRSRGRPDRRDRPRPPQDKPPRPRPAGPARPPGPRPDRSPPPGGPRPRPPAARPSQRDSKPDQPAPFAPPLEVQFLPDEKAFAAMVDTLKQSRRAYALFDIAKLLLNKPERHVVRLKRKPLADGSRPPLYVVAWSDSPFLTHEEALRYALRHHADRIYRETKTPVEPPAGNFTFVNRCGITGEWLGPPNYHEYQPRLIRHHQRRLPRMPFEAFRAKIQTVKDPEAVQAWLQSMSVQTAYECLLDGEPRATFTSFEELEKHFVENHLDAAIVAAAEITLSGPASRAVVQPVILRSIREAWEHERRFPLNTANALRMPFRKEGFSFFKHNKNVTYVTRIRRKRFENLDGLAEQIRNIFLFLRQHPGCTRQKLLAHFLAATPSPPPAQPPETQPAAAPAPPPDAPATTGVEERFLADLYWLIDDGYVVEFSNGRLWALPDAPPKPPPKPAPAPSPAQPADAAAPPAESPAEPAAEPVTETAPPTEPVAKQDVPPDQLGHS
jgi:hypothetical protein